MLTFVLFFAAACAADDQATTSTTVIDANDPAVQLLDQLEERSKSLESFQSKVKYTREQGLLGDSQIRIGTIDYHLGPPSRFAVRFTHMIDNDALRQRPVAYIFDGTWLAEINEDDKQFIRRQIVAPDETYDPLQLGEGPFPFPIGQKRDQVLRLFQVELIEPTDDDAKDTKHLQLTPRVHPETGKPTSQFTKVDIWYDADSLLPVKVVTYEQEADNTTTVELVAPTVDEIDAQDVDEMFNTTAPAAGAGWNVQIKPLESKKQ